MHSGLEVIDFEEAFTCDPAHCRYAEDHQYSQVTFTHICRPTDRLIELVKNIVNAKFVAKRHKLRLTVDIAKLLSTGFIILYNHLNWNPNNHICFCPNCITFYVHRDLF